MSMFYAAFANVIAGLKSVAKSLLSIHPLTISSALIVSLKLASLVRVDLEQT
jgi:hypothetical protein